MECLQYGLDRQVSSEIAKSFKPCYKWNAFNTKMAKLYIFNTTISFKPCYKWNAFNTCRKVA